MTTPNQRVTLQVSCESKGSDAKGPFVMVKHQSLSDFPFRLGGRDVTDDDFAVFQEGQATWVILERGNMKTPGPGKPPNDGSKAFHFYWNFRGFSDGAGPAPSSDDPPPGPDPAGETGGFVPPAGSAAPAARPQPPQPQVWQDVEAIKRVSIHRQQAVQFAGRDLAWFWSASETAGLSIDIMAQAVLDLASHYQRFFDTGDTVIPMLQEPEEEGAS
jgi:hypothetical protein